MLSAHFGLGELVRSNQFPELVAQTLCTEAQIARATSFCNSIEPCREYVEVPMIPSCGNRAMYNHLLDGANPNSDHLWRDETESLAVDLQCAKLGKAFEWFVLHRNEFKMIYLDMKKKFIHVSKLDSTGIVGKVFIKCGNVKIYLER